MLKIHELTKRQLDFYKEQCNFTDEELHCFELRAKKRAIYEISLELNVSERKVSKLIEKIKSKIDTVRKTCEKRTTHN